MIDHPHSMLTACERSGRRPGWNWGLIAALTYTAAAWIAAIAFYNWVTS